MLSLLPPQQEDNMEATDNLAYTEVLLTAGEYELPDIDMDSYEWVPIPRIGRTVPFGYLLHSRSLT